ncbi:MAG TPA: DUF3418 domain-containing protein, partial [Polyangiaceae bacterium]
RLGVEVGYQIRFEDRSTRDTWVKFMTDGVLLAQIQSDPRLFAYDTLIIDEAHERSLTIDFLLGWLKRILPQRPDLKLIVSSATIETARFAEFFDGAPVIQVEGRTYPVEVLYEPPAPELDWSEAVADAVVNVTALDPRGDMLVFLPGEREIREAELALHGRNLRHTEIQPLYSRLSGAEQARVFTDIPQRRVILATNIAETSLTIPGIVYVIDTGVARLSRYDPKTGTTRLQAEAISQASAEQRKGRCGRVREGICVRLYSEDSFVARPAFTDPEMRRTGLAGVILRMKSLGLGEIESFPFLDPPHSRSIAEGYRVLQELGALDEERELTRLGWRLAHFPIDPRLSRMLVAGADNDCLGDVLVVVAALNIQDPRERPRGKEARADQLHRRFRDEQSDFASLLRLWEFVSESSRKGNAQLRRLCQENFLSYVRVREWTDLYRQLDEMLKERPANDRTRDRRAVSSEPAPTAATAGKPPISSTKKPSSAPAERFHQALLTGLLSRIGQWNSETRAYSGARQTRFMLHPSSSLAKSPPAWVMSFELVETAQLYARVNAKIESAWLETVGRHLVRYSYSEPHWSEVSGRASVREHATLFGLAFRKDRSVDYAPIAPERARAMFIEHALVRGEYQSHGAFQQKNRRLLDELAHERDKARQSDMLFDEGRMYAFFDSRVPSSVVNAKTFEEYRTSAEASDPDCLVLSADDVMEAADRPRPEQYPDSLVIQGIELPLQYRFDPSAADDGISITIPLVALPQLADGALDWTIPAWHERKIATLIQELPKDIRRKLAAQTDLASAVASRLLPFTQPLLPALSRAVFDVTGIDVPEAAFRLDVIPAYLKFNCRVVGEKGALLGESRDISGLLRQFSQRARQSLQELTTTHALAKSNLTRWDFGDLPESVNCAIHGTQIVSYPAVVDCGRSVDIRLLETQLAAQQAHRGGLRRLVLLATHSTCAALAKRAPTRLVPGPNALVSREDNAKFVDCLLMRVVDEAFELPTLKDLPRTRTDFERLLSKGTPRLIPEFEQFVQTLAAVSAEYEKLLRAIDNAVRSPSGNTVSADVRSQLTQLFPSDLLATISVARLGSYSRYLRAAQTRIARAVLDPKKDAAKAAPILPLWQRFLAKQALTERRADAERLHWAIEEWRVATFAPELKPTYHVTLDSIVAQLENLR